MDPRLLHHWITPVVWVEDGLGGAWKQHQEERRQCCCCLHRLEQCLAVHKPQLASPPGAPVARTQPARKGSTGVLHLALSNLNLELGGPSACVLWGCTVCFRTGLGCDFFFFFPQVFPRRGSSPHKWCLGEWICLLQLQLNRVCCSAVNAFFPHAPHHQCFLLHLLIPLVTVQQLRQCWPFQAGIQGRNCTSFLCKAPLPPQCAQGCCQCLVPRPTSPSPGPESKSLHSQHGVPLASVQATGQGLGSSSCGHYGDSGQAKQDIGSFRNLGLLCWKSPFYSSNSNFQRLAAA